jgi:hypothetical protein
MTEERLPGGKKPFRLGCLHIFGILLAVVAVLALLAVWWVKSNVYAGKFSPTRLNETEEKVLAAKLDRLDRTDRRPVPAKPSDLSGGPLAPERYTEDESAREIRISEKELNSLIARDEDVARRVAIDLSDHLVSIKLLVPLDEDVPILGGKTLKLTCGLALSYAEGKPVVAVRGVSIGGIPLPGAWWGDIKNTNLVREFGGAGGFWDRFSRGVEDIRVGDGALVVKLKE